MTQMDLNGRAKNTLNDFEKGGYTSGGRGCKHGNEVHHVVTIGKAKIFAGGVSDVRDAVRKGHKFDLFLAVGGPSVASQLFDKTTELGDEAAKMLSELTGRVGSNQMRRRMMVIDWPDFGAPPVGSEWWNLLYQGLSKRVDGDVAIFCQGGHGRTGTALTILSWLNGDNGTEDPVAWVRAKYCDHAVESGSQLEYLKKLGIETAVKGYKEGGYSSTTNGGGKTSWYYDDQAPVADVKDKDICDACLEKPGVYRDDLMMVVCTSCVTKPGFVSH